MQQISNYPTKFQRIYDENPKFHFYAYCRIFYDHSVVRTSVSLFLEISTKISIFSQEFLKSTIKPGTLIKCHGHRYLRSGKV